jgi:endothelin-converting enzyme
MNISDTNPLENIITSAKFAYRRMWAALGKEVDKDQWVTDASDVNAYYVPPHNEIYINAAIMQSPFFDFDVPAYLNYGALGTILGHELSHGFDPHGRLFDQDGRYHDWWTNTTIRSFQERAECFADQYSNFTILNGTQNVDGERTQAENIADAGGLNSAFAAWSKHRETRPDENLPGLDFFTQEQLFFISFGTAFCSKQNEATTLYLASEDSHAPTADVRITGAVANSRAFRESFNCRQKEPMCELW